MVQIRQIKSKKTIVLANLCQKRKKMEIMNDLFANVKFTAFIK
jgi:hypothetical protein